jgi:signal transduction histidine kinase
MVLAAVVGAIGVLTLAEYAFGVNLGVDQLLFHEPAHAIGTSASGRMAVSTAISCVLMSWGLAIVALGPATIEQVLGGATLGYAFSALLSFLYGAEAARPPGTTKVSALSVVGFLFLGVALVLTRPEEGPVGSLLRDEPGGVMARWLLGIGAVIFPLVGAARLAGEQMRLYSASSGVGIMAIASLFALGAAVGVTGNRLNALGRQRTATLERLRESEGRLRRALDRLVDVQENERRGLAMDLHDDALPALAAVNLQVELAAERCPDDDAGRRLERATRELRATTARLRHLTFDLLPEALAREGLGGALRHRLERMQALSGINYQLRDRVGAAVVSQAAAILYRSAVEALRNVARHADATSVVVTIEQDHERVAVTIADNGAGIGPVPPESGHMGLQMMQDRAELAGGGVEISSQRGAGTSVTVWLPANPRPGLPGA